MKNDLPEHIYLKHDIDRAFNWGFQTALEVFEKTAGLSFDNQKFILDRLKGMMIEEKALAVLKKH